MRVIFAAWAIAFVEYCMAVPANRWGSAVYTTAQLKTIQEVITLVVFAGFSILYLKEPMTWNYAIGFALVAVGAFFIFRGPLSERPLLRPPTVHGLRRPDWQVGVPQICQFIQVLQ